ncbi:MAG: transposase [Euryarchaeota archaeon]|nr:transposase [Euryarchaeota archaeon]
MAKRLKGRTSRILRKEFPHLKEWCDEHMWAPSCFHGSVGQGWEVVEKYIQTQDTHHAKNAAYRPRDLKSGVCDCKPLMFCASFNNLNHNNSRGTK